MSNQTKKCPHCAEEIKIEAIKCKHCGSNITKIQEIDKTPKTKMFFGKSFQITSSKQSDEEQQKTKKKANQNYLKLIIWIVGIFVGIFFFYVSIPALLLWYVWKKTKLDKRKKIIISTIIMIPFLILWVVMLIPTETPVLSIVVPKNNFSIQAQNITFKGTVEPKNSTVRVDGTVLKLENGIFTYEAKLLKESNNFTFTATNIDKSVTVNMLINRIFTDEEKVEIEKKEAEEKARIEKRKAEAEAKKQATIEAQKKAEEERIAKELAEQKAWEQSKAGQICKAHPEWSKGDCESVADNKIWIGMSFEMLKYRRGLPDSANPSNYGSGREWQWCWHDYTPSCFYDKDDDGIIDSYN